MRSRFSRRCAEVQHAWLTAALGLGSELENGLAHLRLVHTIAARADEHGSELGWGLEVHRLELRRSPASGPRIASDRRAAAAAEGSLPFLSG
jgi:hypothetical protein